MAPARSESFEQLADSRGFLLDGGEPRLDPDDTFAESMYEAGERDPAGEDGDRFR